jgi:hypothetical protein
LERHPEALRHADAALALGPNREAFLVRGQARYALGEAGPAREDLRKAREMDARPLPDGAAALLRRLEGAGSR